MTLTSISPTFSNYSSDESGSGSYNPSGGGGQSSDEGGSYLMRPIANAFSLALDSVDLPANPASGGLDESGNPLNSGSSNNWWEQAQAIRWQGPAVVTTTALALAEKAPLESAPADVVTPAPAAYISWGESDPYKTTGNGNSQSPQGSTDESGQSGLNSSTAQNLPVGGSSIAAVALAPPAAKADVPAIAAVAVQGKGSVYDPTASAANFNAGVSAQWDINRRAVMEDVHQQYGQFKAQVAQESRFQIEHENFSPDGDRFITFTFDEQSARQEWIHQSHACLESLARLYQLSGQQALIDTRGDVVDLALRGGVAKLEGKAPSGQVMSDEGDIIKLDAYLKSDMNQVLILKFGQGPMEPAHSAVALEQLRKYGDARLEQFNRLKQALAHVQSDYAQAKARALNDSTGPGWSDVKVQVPIYDRQTEAETLFLTGYQTETQRQFSSQAFSQWYGGQWDRTEKTISNGAFARIYGTEIDYVKQGEYNVNGDYSGDVAASKFVIKVGEETLTLQLEGNRIEQEFVITLDLNAAPDLHNNEAVGWNPFVGWTTSAENIDEGTDWAFTIASIFVIAAISYFSAGALSGEAIALFGAAEGGLAAAAITGAIAGGTGAITSGLINDNLSWEGVLKGMVFGAVGGAANFAVGELAQAGGAATYTQVLQEGGAGVQMVPDVGVTGGGPVQRAFDPSRGLTVSDASDSVQRAADLAGSRTFGAISTGGRVLIGGALTLARGGSFEDGVLTTLGSIVGQEVGETVGQGLNQASDGALSTGATSYIGRVLGAGLSSELVNQRGGRGDLAFLNAVVDATVGTIKLSNSDSSVITGTAFAQGPDQSAAETERLGRQSLTVDGPINVPAPNLVGDTPITPITSPTVANNEGPTPIVGANKEAGSGTQGLSAAQSEALARNAGQLSTVRTALNEQALAAQSRQIATSNTSPVVASTENASGESDLITIVIRAPRLPTDAQGNSYEENAAGQVLVNLKGGGTLVLNAELSAAALATIRLATIGSLVGDATLGVSASAGLGTVGGWIADGLAAVLKLPIEALVLMSIPSNVGQGSQITELHNDTRFEQRPGELFGRLMARDPETNQWVVARDNMIKVETATGFAIISAEDAARLSGPLSLPLPALQPGGSPPLVISPISQGDNNGSTSFPAASPVAPTLTTTPIPAQRSVEDLIVEARSNAEQKRFRDGLIDEAKRLDPSFDPTGYEAHHIFKLNGGSPAMQQLRTELERLGFHLNDVANGVMLPGARADQTATGAYHPRLDNDLYNDTVVNELLGVTSANEARDILQRIGNKLRANDYPGIRPKSGQ